MCMKQLHSPWRSTYIQTFKEKKKKKECLFCSILRKSDDSKNLIAWRGQRCCVVLNRFPYNSGHLLIVPYKHTKDFSKLTDNELKEIMIVTRRCINALKKISKPEGFNFGSNIGTVAGAGIADHIHFHIVPRWNGDTNFMPVLASLKIISEDINKIHKNISEVLRKDSIEYDT